MARFQLPCLGLALLSLSAPSISTAYISPSASGQFKLRLPEYDAYLLRDNQTRLNWHVMNEAHHALVTGGMITASYVLHRINAKGIPVYPLMTAAHVVMDWTLSQSVKDFALRQLVRTPFIAWRWYTGSGLHPWANALIQESPTLLMGVWEMWIQSQDDLPEGTRTIHLDPEPVRIQYSTIGVPQFIIRFNGQQVSCPALESESDNRSYRDYLTLLSCAAHNKAISTLEIKPDVDPSTSEKLLGIKAIKENGESLLKAIVVISPHNEPWSQKPWITDILSKPPSKNSVGKALSPLTEKALFTLSQTLIDDTNQKYTSLHENDLDVNVVSGASMLVTGLGTTAYLLADHTDSQGLSLPQLWLGMESLVPDHQTTAALQQLEARRIPGPEYGAWRLLTAARSIVHHTLFEQAFRWLSDTSLKKKEPAEYKFTKNGYTLVRTSDDLNVEGANEILQIISEAKGRKMVIMGRPNTGKTHIANAIIGESMFQKTHTVTPATEIQIYTKNGHQVIELAPFSNNTTPTTLLDEVKHQIITAAGGATYVIPQGLILDADKKAFERLESLFPLEGEASCKLTVTINNLMDLSLDNLKWITDTIPLQPRRTTGIPTDSKRYTVGWFTSNNDETTSRDFKELRAQFQIPTSDE